MSPNGDNTGSASWQRVTHDGQRKLGPAFMPSGAVAVAVHESPNLVAIRRMELSQDGSTRLHPAVPAHQFDPAFSRDGRWHAYAMSAGSPQLVLVIQDGEANSEHVYRPREARATARCPTFSPDGARIVFSLSDVDGHQLASVNPQGEELQLLTKSAGLNISPAFSPDGKQIAFSSSRSGDFEIYVADADGTNVRQLTASPGLDVRPTWSPDGQRIAFTSNRDGLYQIYVMAADGSKPRRLEFGAPGVRHDYAVWHPGGDRLLVVSEHLGRSDLYLVPVPKNL